MKPVRSKVIAATAGSATGSQIAVVAVWALGSYGVPELVAVSIAGLLVTASTLGAGWAKREVVR